MQLYNIKRKCLKADQQIHDILNIIEALLSEQDIDESFLLSIDVLQRYARETFEAIDNHLKAQLEANAHID